MVISSAAFTGMSALIKALGPDFPTAEAAMFRALFGLPVVAGLMWRARVSPRLSRPWLMLVRGLFGLAAMLGFFYSLQRGVLANMVILHRSQPVWMAVLAPMLLKEKVPPSIGVVVAVSLVGVFMVVQPSSAGIDWASAAGLGGALSSAFAHMAVRRLSVTHHPLVIVFGFGLITTVGAALIAAPVLVIPSLRDLALLGGAALCATVGQVSMTMAYGRDRAPVVAAASYSSVVFSLLVGLLLWGELPNTLALTGGSAIVVAGGVLIASRRKHREPPT